MSSPDTPKKFLYSKNRNKGNQAFDGETQFDYSSGETRSKPALSLTDLDKDILLSMKHNRSNSVQPATSAYDFTTNQSYYSRYGSDSLKRVDSESQKTRTTGSSWSSGTRSYGPVSLRPSSKPGEDSSEFW